MNTNLTLLLNSDYTPLGVLNWTDAIIKVLFRGNAEVLHYYDNDSIKTVNGPIPKPSVIRLKVYVNFRPKRVPFSVSAVKKRDDYTCQYCSKRTVKDITVDHVLPKSRGGKNSFTNLVCACFECNTKKADMTPEEAGMPLLSRPTRPIFPIIISPHMHWQQYLF